MSFAGDVSGLSNAAGGSNKPYFCYQCNRTVTVTISPSTDPFCPLCNEGFLEECENPNPNSIPTHHHQIPRPNSFSDPFFPFSDPLSSFLPLIFQSSSSTNAADLLGSTRQARADPFAFDPIEFLRNHLSNLHSDGARIQFVIENQPSESGFRLPQNIGDYYFGPGLEQLIQQLAENDPSRYGTPPASKSAINSLPSVKITDQHLNSELNQCAVCQEFFEKGTEVKQMPCKHVYHKDCIIPWLELHNSCPVCRHELPTADQDYEQRVRAGQGSGGSNSGEQGSGGGNRTVERSFRISLPWPFRGRGSDSGSGGDGADTRYEDLD